MRTSWIGRRFTLWVVCSLWCVLIGHVESRATTKDACSLDVVVVGGGLAGLAAAHQLRDRSLLLLEKENRLGGRILTGQAEGVAYDLGALFAPVGMDAALAGVAPLRQDHPSGLSIDGQVVLAADMRSAIRQVLNTPAEVAALDAFPNWPPSLWQEQKRLASLLDAAFGLVHPLPIQRYGAWRWGDAFQASGFAHLPNGNRTIVEALQPPPSKVALEAEVFRIERASDGCIETQFLRAGRAETARSRTAIVATPAGVASRILPGANDAAQSFLGSIEFGAGSSLALVSKAPPEPRFSYIATPGAPFDSLFLSATEDEDAFVLTVYFRQDASNKIRSLSLPAVVDLVLEELPRLGVQGIDATTVVASDMRHWDELSPLIDDAAKEKATDAVWQPVPNVFLAGDYTFWEGNMPYGMGAAWASGRRASERARAAMTASGGTARSETTGANAAPFTAEPLTMCYRFDISEDRPRYTNMGPLGDIAFYGWILKAGFQADVAAYLVEQAVGDEWAYGRGIPPTAADSAFVLEGLQEHGRHPKLTRAGLARIVADYVDPESGGVRTAHAGPSAYWTEPALETTAHVGFLLAREKDAAFENPIRHMREFVLARQDPNGGWKGRWFPSHIVSTFFAVRFLEASGGLPEDARAHAASYLVGRQKENGSVNDSRIDTSAAILALASLDTGRPAVASAAKWLRQRDDRATEMILYYGDLSGADRLFFACMDRGEIGVAWRRLALASLGNP